MSETASQLSAKDIHSKAQPEKVQPTSVKPEQLSLEPLPRNPESFAKATLKGTIEAGATFIKAATSPSYTPVEEIKVKLFNKEPPSVNISNAVREAFRRKTVEQMYPAVKREQKSASPARTRTKKPERANERQQAREVRSQLAQLQKAA